MSREGRSPDVTATFNPAGGVVGEEEEPEGTSSESQFWDSGSRLVTQLPHLLEAQ